MNIPPMTVSEDGDITLPPEELLTESAKLIKDALNTIEGCENMDVRFINIAHAMLNPFREKYNFIIRDLK